MKKGIVAFAIEDRGGYSFNGRSLSKDRLMMEDLQRRIAPCQIVTIDSESMLMQLSQQEYLLRENDFIKSEETLVVFANVILPSQIRKTFSDIKEWDYFLYRWNRSYPADQYFSENLALDWALVSKEDIVGSSHPKITFEHWRKNVDE